MIAMPFGFNRSVAGAATSQPAILAGSLVTAGATTTTSLTIPNVAVSAGSNRALILLLSNNTLSNIDTALRDGQSFSMIGRQKGATYSGVHAYILLNPNIGTSSIVITMTAVASMYAATFQANNVNQTTATADGIGVTGTSGITSITVPNRTASDLVIGGVSVDYNGSSVAVTTGTPIVIGNQSWADSGFAYNESGAVIAFSHNNAQRSGYAFRVLPV